MKNKSNIVFDSRISKKIEKDLYIKFKVDENELNLLTNFFQIFKRKENMKYSNIEIFCKNIILDVAKKVIEEENLNANL